MRIVGFQSENFKKLRAVHITPDVDGVTITGANEQGKTSILDAIWSVFDWKNASKDITEPIRRGEEKAVNRIDLDNGLTATRSFTKKGTYLKVENTIQGSEYKSPQAVLDKLVGNLSFDPLAFSQMKEKEQLETLLALVQLPIDLNEWAAQRKQAYDERTAVNRKLAELTNQIKGIMLPDDVPDDEISAASILNQQKHAQAIKEGNDSIRRELSKLDDKVAYGEHEVQNMKDDIDRLEKQLGSMKAELEAKNAKLSEYKDKYDVLKVDVDTLKDPDLSIFESKITEVESTNRLVRAKKQRAKLEAQAEDAQKGAELLTREIAARDQERAEALKAAKMPIEELSFNDDGVLYKGIPFKQCSSAERLRVSIAMGMALNPKLRVMFVRDASLLDTKHKEIIKQMAKDQRYQLWIEQTDDSGKVGLYIEDGEIKNG